MSEHPSGWYPDPRGRHEYRYWDGQRWTDHVADDGQATTDPVNAPRTAAQPREPDVDPRTATTPAGGQPGATGQEATQPAAGGSLWQGSGGALRDPAAAHPAEGEDDRRLPQAAGHPHPADADADADAGAATAAGAGAPSPGRAEAPGATQTTGAGAEPGLGEQAREAVRSATATKSPGLAGLLTVVFPGAGHFYLGAGERPLLPIGLLAATVVGYAISWISFGAFVAGFVLWAAAATVGILSLQSVLRPIREAGAAAASVSAQQVGLVLIAGGLLLVAGLLLPWYHVQIDTVVAIGPFESSQQGFSRTQNAFEALAVIDWLLLIVAAGSIVLGATAMGIGPLREQRLPAWLPIATAVVGIAGLVLVALRLVAGVTNLPDAPGIDYDVGRGPGILLAGAATLGIAAAGVVTVLQARRATPAATTDAPVSGASGP